MNGGYALARDAREISAYEVIHAIDGPFFITSCTKGAKGCELTPSCTIKEPLARVNDTIAGVLKSISIQDLAEHEQPAGHAHEAQCAGFPNALTFEFFLRPQLTRSRTSNEDGDCR